MYNKIIEQMRKYRTPFYNDTMLIRLNKYDHENIKKEAKKQLITKSQLVRIKLGIDKEWIK